MRRFSVRLALAYVLVSATYILVSDIALQVFWQGSGKDGILTVEVVKGLLFVVLTGIGILVYGMRNANRLDASQRQLDDRDEELARLKATFEVVSSSINDGFFLLDKELRFTHANPSYLRLIDRTENDVLGRPWVEVAHETPQLLEQLQNSVATQQPSVVESFDEVLNQWYRVLMFPHSLGVVVLYRNITDSKLQGLRFMHEHANLLALINNTSDYIAAVDTECRLIVANTPYLDRLEYLTGTRPQPGDITIVTPLGDEVIQKWTLWLQRAFAGERFSVEWEFQHPKTGEIVDIVSFNPIMRDGVIEGATILIHNITEVRRTQRELRQQVDRYDLISMATNDAIWEWNLETGRLYWNSGLNVLFGYDIQETSMAWWKERIHESDRTATVVGLEQWVVEGAGAWRSEYRFLCADGSYRWVLDRGFALRDTSGQPSRLVGAMTDITAERESRAHMERQNVGLREIAHISSHELRGPLASLMGLLHLVDREHPDNPQNVQIVTMLDEAAASMDAVIHRLVQKTYEIEKSADRMAR